MSSSVSTSLSAPFSRSSLWLALTALLLFPSCDLFNDESEPDTGIRFISFLTGGAAYDAQLSGETIQIATMVPGLTPADPGDVPVFSSVESGRRRYQIRSVGSDAEIIHQGTLTLRVDTLYTTYLTGDADNASVTLIGESALSAPAEGALVRIVHAYSRVGAVQANIHEVQPSPGGGLDAGALIESIDNLPHGEASAILQTTQGQIAVLVSAGGRQAPMLLLSPIAGRLYTIVVTQPAGVFGAMNFGLATYQEEL